MRICICTTPLRDHASPPFGCMAIIQSLRKMGEEADLFDIDHFRPDHEEIVAYFSENQFDLVGISAIVSTAYKNTKYLADIIRSVSPQTMIVVGGRLGASAEILLRKTEVDFCVIGDGELIIRDFVMVLDKNTWTYEDMKAIVGLCFLDESEQFHFTGYRHNLPADEIEMPDYSLLEIDGADPYNGITDEPRWFQPYGIEIPEEMRGKKHAIIWTAAGCVARCTFCHRWEKGYRVRPMDQLQGHLQHLKDKYNVGFLSMGDETFGSDRRHTTELVPHLGEMGFIWRAGGVRARTVDLETLQFWKDNGCRMVIYGIESGSQTMLDVMEKKTTVQMNLDAIKWTHEAGLSTVVQLVIGMPGETDQTIRETIEFLKDCVPHLHIFGGLPGSSISINYAQALPGTPLYEYAREHGVIGKTVDKEEQYLIKISDTDAYAMDHFVNYTEQPMLKVMTWVYRISGELDADYIHDTIGIKLSVQQVVVSILLTTIRHFSGKIFPKLRMIIKTPLDHAAGKYLKGGDQDHGGYFNVRGPGAFSLFFFPGIRQWSYPIVALAIAVTNAESLPHFLKLISAHIKWSLMRRFIPMPDLPEKSLRKLVQVEPTEDPAQGSDMMIPLRLGR